MSDIPKSGGKRKPTPKKSFSLEDFKKKTGTETIKDKPLTWYRISKAFQEATGLPGYPRGYLSLVRGLSNTGKSTAVSEVAVAAQKMGDFVIIIDTENNIGASRLETMGFDFEDNTILINNEYLLEKFGRVKDKNLSEATIEDLADCISHFLNLQDSGDLPMNICFIIDSIGTLSCIKSVNSADKGSPDNNQWNAGAYERAFKYIINSRIPLSRKENKEYTNTIIGVQKIWLQPNPMGMPTVKHKGGESMLFAARLITHHGGIASQGIKKITATSKKREVLFGTESKVSIAKNHIDGQYGGINMEGKIISTPHGFIGTSKEDIEEYKKEHMLYFRNLLGGDLEEIKTEEIFDAETGEVYE